MTNHVTWSLRIFFALALVLVVAPALGIWLVITTAIDAVKILNDTRKTEVVLESSRKGGRGV